MHQDFNVSTMPDIPVLLLISLAMVTPMIECLAIHQYVLRPRAVEQRLPTCFPRSSVTSHSLHTLCQVGASLAKICPLLFTRAGYILRGCGSAVDCTAKHFIKTNAEESSLRAPCYYLQQDVQCCSWCHRPHIAETHHTNVSERSSQLHGLIPVI